MEEGLNTSSAGRSCWRRSFHDGPADDRVAHRGTPAGQSGQSDGGWLLAALALLAHRDTAGTRPPTDENFWVLPAVHRWAQSDLRRWAERNPRSRHPWCRYPRVICRLAVDIPAGDWCAPPSGGT